MGFPKFLKVAVMCTKQQVEIEGTIVEKMVPREFDARLTETLANAIGFSYELLIPSDGEFGRLLSNGSWTGMLGLIQKKDADIVISSLAISEQRLDAFRFSIPYDYGEVTFVTRKQQSLNNLALFLHPFSIGIWISMLICIFVIPLIARTVMHKKYTLSLLFTWTISQLLRQPKVIEPLKLEQYLLIAAWLFGTSFLGFCYSAVLLSFVAVPTFAGIRTINELANGIKAGTHHCSATPGSYFASDLMKSNMPNLQVIANSLNRSKQYPHFLDALENETDPLEPAFVGDRDAFILYKQNYFISEDRFFSSLTALAMRKDFCCRSELDEVLIRGLETGVLQKLVLGKQFRIFTERYWRTEKKFGNAELESKLPVSVFKGPFAFLALFYILALLVLFVEICLGKAKLKEVKGKNISKNRALLFKKRNRVDAIRKKRRKFSIKL